MDQVIEIINQISREQQILILVGILGFVIIFTAYYFFRLKNFRKTFVMLENKMNAIKTLPIQYRLGRVQGIMRSMPNVDVDFENFQKRHVELSRFQETELLSVINEIDEKLYSRKTRGVKRKLRLLRDKIDQYEKDSKTLLDEIESVTEVENIQRLAIIKIKEKYRNTQDEYQTNRCKIDDYIPLIDNEFKDIDQCFVKLENFMNDQEFEQAKEYTNVIDKKIDMLFANIRDLPSYVAIIRKYIPQRLKVIHEKAESMKKTGFALERIHLDERLQKIDYDTNSMTNDIKLLKLASVAQAIEVITVELDGLMNDLETEEVAFGGFAKKSKETFDLVESLEKQLSETVESLFELQKNYHVHFEFDIKSDYDKFLAIMSRLSDYRHAILDNVFSYGQMMAEFDKIVEECQPYLELLVIYKEKKESLRIQEKRALDELDNINIVLLEIKSEIKNKQLPMISETYQDYIDDSYQRAEEILKFTRQRPIDLEKLSLQVDTARDVIYELYDNIHNLIVTAEMVEDAIVYGNRYRSTFLEVNTELTKAELLFKNGEYTKALTIAVDIIEKIKPGSYETLVNSTKKSEKI
ncbi:septation ring formation regulator EzrA [Tannockella kyphosi]|uniref:septation ring formation regulator EzrA n=1 Tax=Tannockella kyphosi TaxID=2899121 RepID=UPI002012AA63|nr:septation ring formation regulator EzrA [Tannockella kyphosi]